MVHPPCRTKKEQDKWHEIFYAVQKKGGAYSPAGVATNMMGCAHSDTRRPGHKRGCRK